MAYKVLTAEQVDQFMDLGWVTIKAAFSKEKALACQEFLWTKLAERGMHKDDPSTWTVPLYFLKESYRNSDFDACNTERMANAIEDLIGEGRWKERQIYDGTEKDYPIWGWWPVNFYNGKDEEWTVPTNGWHWDGQHFRHYIDSPNQGLLCLCIFSEVNSHGGGTLIAEGSHKLVARYLSKFPDGVDIHEAIVDLCSIHPWLAELTGRIVPSDSDSESRINKFMNWSTDQDGIKLRVLETTGSPGDVILCHPFLFHSWSQNHLGIPRFMCNRTTPLTDRMNLQREDSSESSPLELSIQRALHQSK